MFRDVLAWYRSGPDSLGRYCVGTLGCSVGLWGGAFLALGISNDLTASTIIAAALTLLLGPPGLVSGVRAFRYGQTLIGLAGIVLCGGPLLFLVWLATSG